MEVEIATVTLNEIRSFLPCAYGWTKLLRSLGKTEADDTPVRMSQILDSNGLDDAVWCLRVFYKNYRQRVIDFACDCADRVLSVWEMWAKINAPEHFDAPRKAIEVARNSSFDAASDAATRAATRAAAAAYADAYDAAAYDAAADAYYAYDAATRAAAAAAAHAADAVTRAADARAAAAHAADAAAYAAATRAAAAYTEEIMQEKFLIKHFG